MPASPAIADAPTPRRWSRRLLRLAGTALVALAVLAVVAAAAMYRADVPLTELTARYAAPPSQFLDVDGLRVHVRDEGAGPPLLLLHGTAASLHTWDGWVRELSDTRRIIRVDLAGFGLTGPAPDGDYRVERQARMVRALLDRLGVARADVAGNSHGGRVALTLALAYPERVRKLVLIDAAGYADAPPPRLFQMARNPVVKRVLLHLTPKFFVRKNLEEVYGDPAKVTDDTVTRYHAMALRAGNRAALVARLNGPPEPLLADRLGELTLPVLILWGEEDRWVPLAQGQALARGIAGAELRVYPGVGHVPMEEIPEQTARDADAFLN
jgi:pimeloyl-ACP methyl ester carboxylesterase